MAINSTELVLLLVSLMSSLVFSFYTLYGWWLLRKCHSQYWMKQRWSLQQIDMFCLLSLIYTCSRPLTLYEIYNRQNGRVGRLDSMKYIVYYLSTVFSMIPLSGIVLVFALRVWSQFNDAMYAVEIGVVKWRSMIDDSIINEQSSWFLRNRMTFGNRAYLSKWMFYWWLLFSLLFFVGIAFWIWLDVIVVVLLTSAICVLIFYISYRYPSFKDSLLLRYDNRLAAHWAALCTSIWVVAISIGIVIGHDWSDITHRRILVSLAFIRGIIATITIPGIVFITSNLVIQHFEQTRFSVSCPCASNIRIPLAFEFSTLTDYRSESTITPAFRPSLQVFSDSLRLSDRNTSECTINEIKLSHVLADDTAFRAMMEHLFSEFSIQNALCLIECMKFRQRMRQLMDEPSELFQGLVLCDDIQNTRSSLVSRMDSLTLARSVALRIYGRYMTNGSPDCVNLSHRVRMEVFSLLSDLDHELQSDVFDAVITQCIRLLKDSFSRFCHTQGFQQLEMTISQ